MGAFDIQGTKVTSLRFGVFPILRPKYKSLRENPTPTDTYNTVTLVPSYIPWEITIIPFKENSTTSSNYQWTDYLEDFGFPTIAPFSLEKLFTNSEKPDSTKSYYDVWDFSNGTRYYVYNRGTSSGDQIGLSTSPNLSSSSDISNTIPFTNMRVTNNNICVTPLCFNESLDNTYAYGYGVYLTYNGTFFTIRNNQDSGRMDNFPPVRYSLTDEAKSFYNNLPIDISTDPYDAGGNTEPSEPHGTFDDTTTPIPIPSLPSFPGGTPGVGVSESGMIKLFNPTLSQLQSLGAYMWSTSLFDLSTWQKLFADPMDAIIMLSIVPVTIPNEASVEIKVGNIGTGINARLATKQFVELDCGTISIEEFYGGYLDYQPYTNIEIFLPYIGLRKLSADDIMAKDIHLVYHIDILSGACVAYISVDSSVLYNFSGHCSLQIPLSGTDMSTMLTGILNISAGIATMGYGLNTGSGALAAGGELQASSNAINNLKPIIEKGGNIGSALGLLSIQTPYIIITRPRQALPLNQNHYTGYPSFITSLLSSLSGFTQVYEIHLENVHATANELDEIVQLLQEGVII